MPEQALSGRGSVVVGGSPSAVWATLLDASVLRRVIPGAEHVERLDAVSFRATISFGVGRFRGRYLAELVLPCMDEPRALDLVGASSGAFGNGSASAHVTLTNTGRGATRVHWTYRGTVSGPVAIAGRILLQVASDIFVHRFFAALARCISSADNLTAEVAVPAGRPQQPT